MPQITPSSITSSQFNSSGSTITSANLAAGDWAVFTVGHTPDTQIHVRPATVGSENGDSPTITFGTISAFGSLSPADLTREPTSAGSSWVPLKNPAGADITFSANGGSAVLDTYHIIALRRVGGTGNVQAIVKSNLNR